MPAGSGMTREMSGKLAAAALEIATSSSSSPLTGARYEGLTGWATFFAVFLIFILPDVDQNHA